MFENYEQEQKQLKDSVTELKAFIEATEQKTADASNFIRFVRKYTYINVLTPEIMHKLVEKIVTRPINRAGIDSRKWHTGIGVPCGRNNKSS